MPAAVIRIEYQDFDGITKTADEKAQAVEQLFQEVSGQMDVLRGGAWVGDNANKFFQEMENTVFPALNKLRDAFARLSEDGQKIIVTFQNAEDEGANIWKRR